MTIDSQQKVSEARNQFLIEADSLRAKLRQRLSNNKKNYKNSLLDRLRRVFDNRKGRVF